MERQPTRSDMRVPSRRCGAGRRPGRCYRHRGRRRARLIRHRRGCGGALSPASPERVGAELLLRPRPAEQPTQRRRVHCLSSRPASTFATSPGTSATSRPSARYGSPQDGHAAAGRWSAKQASQQRRAGAKEALLRCRRVSPSSDQCRGASIRPCRRVLPTWFRTISLASPGVARRPRSTCRRCSVSSALVAEG